MDVDKDGCICMPLQNYVVCKVSLLSDTGHMLQGDGSTRLLYYFKLTALVSKTENPTTCAHVILVCAWLLRNPLSYTAV